MFGGFFGWVKSFFVKPLPAPVPPTPIRPGMGMPTVPDTRTRGIRNNNPGNIERTSTVWEGMNPDQSGDPRFIVFLTPAYGIRALIKVLETYQREGLDTLRDMINRWAPPVENNTQAYITYVSTYSGINPDAKVNMDSIQDCLPIVAGIIAFENAGFAYPKDILSQAFVMAGS